MAALSSIGNKKNQKMREAIDELVTKCGFQASDLVKVYSASFE